MDVFELIIGGGIVLITVGILFFKDVDLSDAKWWNLILLIVIFILSIFLLILVLINFIDGHILKSLLYGIAGIVLLFIDIIMRDEYRKDNKVNELLFRKIEDGHWQIYAGDLVWTYNYISDWGWNMTEYATMLELQPEDAVVLISEDIGLFGGGRVISAYKAGFEKYIKHKVMIVHNAAMGLKSEDVAYSTGRLKSHTNIIVPQGTILCDVYSNAELFEELLSASRRIFIDLSDK